jgi:hypothetical protein
MTKSYKKGVFFFHILYSAAISRSSICDDRILLPADEDDDESAAAAALPLCVLSAMLPVK